MTAAPRGELLITVEDEPRAAVVSPVGVLDIATCVRLREALLKCSANEPPGIVVDLSGLVVPSPALLAVLTAVSIRLQEWPGIPLVLAAPTRSVGEMLRRTGIARFIPVHPNREAALAAVRAPPVRRRLTASLAAEPGSVALARRLVEGVCRDWGLDRLRDDARLIVSELVGNAVQHARSQPVLRLEWTGERFVVAVVDSDPDPPLALDPAPSQPAGRGLQLIAAIATCWGYAPTATGGKVVWATIRPPAVRPGGGGANDPPQPRGE